MLSRLQLPSLPVLCLSTVTVCIWQCYSGWEAEVAVLGSLPIAPQAVFPLPIWSQEQSEMWGALCSCSLQGTEVFTATQAAGTFPCLSPAFSLLTAFGKQGSHPRCHRAGCTGSWGLEGEACVGFFPFSLSAGTSLPQISLWLLWPPALVPRELQAAGRDVLALLRAGWDGVRRWQILGTEQRPWNCPRAACFHLGYCITMAEVHGGTLLFMS